MPKLSINNNVHNKDREFLGRRCFHCKVHQKFGKLSQIQIKNQAKQLRMFFSVVAYFGPSTAIPVGSQEVPLSSKLSHPSSLFWGVSLLKITTTPKLLKLLPNCFSRVVTIRAESPLITTTSRNSETNALCRNYTCSCTLSSVRHLKYNILGADSIDTEANAESFSLELQLEKYFCNACRRSCMLFLQLFLDFQLAFQVQSVKNLCQVLLTQATTFWFATALARAGSVSSVNSEECQNPLLLKKCCSKPPISIFRKSSRICIAVL